MSHFTVLVITSLKNDVEEQIVEESDSLLAPYSENLKVDEYDRPCYCCGTKARKDVNSQSEEKFGSWNDIRTNFNEICPKPPKPIEDLSGEEREKGMARCFQKTY